ncbi:low specificity L-threonine aldolase [Acuticoccus sediminis]|uniref:L-threonine aldolase n=1 Tax=Acuticoccus sediminis TaxID=2184697 RepID=A0A8B2NW49_9HYPH|nr:beta-eliminating lyase-related protein [Acuticoccus sediminis]RAI01754.1 low specificity L-threonine aldolase [Acuticoccus sediminis]
MVDLRSDNVAGAAPQIVEAVVRASTGTARSYGADEWTARLQTAFSELFEHDCVVQPTLTGTATNALALSLLVPAWGAVCCSGVAHIHDSECGAGEMFTGGAKLIPLGHEEGRLRPAVLERYLAKAAGAGTAVAPPKVLSLTEATECGTLYNVDEVAELAAVARGFGLRVHMDGARFANAVAALGCTPAELTWRSGVDVLSFGATKNGALAAEAVVAFDPALAEALRYRARKAGQVLSKMRFVSAQLDAYVADGLWLNLAGHANKMAARLAGGMRSIDGIALLYPVDINEIFCRVDEVLSSRLDAANVGFFDRGEGEIRMVTAFSNTADEMDEIINILHSA